MERNIHDLAALDLAGRIKFAVITILDQDPRRTRFLKEALGLVAKTLVSSYEPLSLDKSENKGGKDVI